MRRTGAIALALVLTACGSTVTGQGAVGGRSPAAPPASSSSSSSSSGPATSPGSSAAAGPLAARLMTPPAGSVPWTSAWAHQRTPTVEQFVRWAYPAAYVASEVRLFHSYGIQDLAHETWYAQDRDQADMVLFRFQTEEGATRRFIGATGAKAAVPGIRSFTVPGTTAIGYYRPQLDKFGNITAVVYAISGRLVVEEFYYSPKTLRPADARAWMRAQLTRLR